MNTSKVNRLICDVLNEPQGAPQRCTDLVCLNVKGSQTYDFASGLSSFKSYFCHLLAVKLGKLFNLSDCFLLYEIITDLSHQLLRGLNKSTVNGT